MSLKRVGHHWTPQTIAIIASFRFFLAQTVLLPHHDGSARPRSRQEGFTLFLGLGAGFLAVVLAALKPQPRRGRPGVMGGLSRGPRDRAHLINKNPIDSTDVGFASASLSPVFCSVLMILVPYDLCVFPEFCNVISRGCPSRLSVLVSTWNRRRAQSHPWVYSLQHIPVNFSDVVCPCYQVKLRTKVLRILVLSLGLQPYPQKVVRPPKPTPTTFSGGGWSPRVYRYLCNPELVRPEVPLWPSAPSSGLC